MSIKGDDCELGEIHLFEVGNKNDEEHEKAENEKIKRYSKYEEIERKLEESNKFKN